MKFSKIRMKKMISNDYGAALTITIFIVVVLISLSGALVFSANISTKKVNNETKQTLRTLELENVLYEYINNFQPNDYLNRVEYFKNSQKYLISTRENEGKFTFTIEKYLTEEESRKSRIKNKYFFTVTFVDEIYKIDKKGYVNE